MGVQCQSMWHPRVNNSWTFVGKATKQWCTCDRRELCSSSHVKPPFSLDRGQYVATLTLEATFCSRIVCPPLERGSEICRRDFIWESVWWVFFRGFTILILSSQSNPLLWSGQKADLGQECCSREFTICILCIQEAYFWEGWVLGFVFVIFVVLFN